MLELLIAKLAGVSLLAKTGVAAAAVVAGTTGAGLTGNLPDQAQGAFDRALGEAPAEQPEDDADLSGDDVEELEPLDEADEVDEVEPVDEGDDADDTDDADEGDEGERPEAPGAEGRATADEHAGENGAEGRARADEAATDGRAYGERQATEGRANAPAERQRTGQDAATPGRDRAATAPSGGNDTAGDRPTAPERSQPEETAEQAPEGTQPEATPAGPSQSGEDAASSVEDGARAGGRP